MIHIIASIAVAEGKMQEALDIYTSFVPKVLREDGCLMYLPTLDHVTDIGTQIYAPDILTVIEQWQDMDSFQAHLIAPHVITFRKDIQGVVENVSIKVLEQAIK